MSQNPTRTSNRFLCWLVRWAVRGSIATADDVLAAVEHEHPTAIADYARLRQRATWLEQLADDERAQPGSSTSVAMPRGLSSTRGWDEASGHVWRKDVWR